MTATEFAVVACGLAIGYWLVSVFVPHARRAPGAENGAATAGRTTVDIGETPWHDVLGIAPDAGREAIHDAYRRRLAQYHPDRVAGLAPEIRALAERRAMELDVAYDRALMQLHDRGH